MLRQAATAFLLVLSLAACAAETPPPDTAVMPQGALGTNGDIDTRALGVAAFDFANPTRGDPARVADGVAALDYMGGELESSPRWIDFTSLAPEEMLQARATVRQYVGIKPDASSQSVVDTMLALAQAYRAHDQDAIRQLLADPIFDAPSAAVAARLSDFPRIASVNTATTRADGEAPDANFPE